MFSCNNQQRISNILLSNGPYFVVELGSKLTHDIIHFNVTLLEQTVPSNIFFQHVEWQPTYVDVLLFLKTKAMYFLFKNW